MPHHITKQPIIEDDVAGSDIEEMEVEQPLFDPDTPSTSSETACNGTGNGEESLIEGVSEKDEPVLPEGKQEGD